MESKLKRAIATVGPRGRWDYGAVLGNARALQSLEETGGARTMLEGKHVAMLFEKVRSGDADLFLSAARGLGAQVAEIRTDLWPTLPREEVIRMAALLGCLYGAVECQGMVQPIVQMIQAATCIPVYDHLASPNHPTAQVVEWLEGDAPGEEKRRLVMQAVLLGTIA